MRRPSPLNWTAVGYQPVGMKPLTALAPGRLTSTTATALLSALATSSVRPSGERVGRAARGCVRMERHRDLLLRRARGEVHDPHRVRVGAGHEQPRAVLRE